MTFLTITANKPGKCRRCGGPIYVGQRIRWARGGGSYHLKAECEREGSPEDVQCQDAAAEERANLRYWERVDNYRELGYDPN